VNSIINSNTTRYLLVGALAGLFSDAIVHPIDTIRTNTIIRSIGHDATHQAFKINFKSLYRGFSVVGLFTVPAHASYFLSYEKSKEYLKPLLKSDNMTYLASGLVADIFGGLFWCPMDVMKQRFQYHQKLTFKEMFAGGNSLRMIYKGFGTSIVVYGPYVSLYFMLYENLKKMHSKTFETKLSLPHYILYASMASSMSAIVTTPLDVIKTKVQTLDIYKTPFDVIRKVSPLTNFRVYMTGWKPRALWMSTGTALSMVFYEEFKKILVLPVNKESSNK